MHRSMVRSVKNSSSFKAAILVTFGFVFLGIISYALASTYTFSNVQGNGDWNDPLNWSDSTVPIFADNAVLEGSVSTNSGLAAEVVDLTVVSASVEIPITVHGHAYFHNNTILQASGSITGSATFNNFATNNGGTVTGDATFVSETHNSGMIGSNGFFSDFAYNEGVVAGNAEFSDSSYNAAAGTIMGTATFYDDLTENQGSVQGSAIRHYTVNVTPITPNRDFTGWNEIIADAAVVTLDGSSGLDGVTFTAMNGGSFIFGACMDAEANNYDPRATYDDATCEYDDPGVPGCTDPGANNYNAEATEDDGSCEYGEDPIPGCTDPEANNYNSEANEDDGSCTYDPVVGCTDPEAENYNPEANEDDGSCEYPDTEAPTLLFFSSDPDSGTHGEGATITIFANFNENLGVGSTMTVNLDTGDQVVLENIIDETLGGVYTVSEGDTSSDLTISDIDSASILDLETNTETTYSIPSEQNLGDNSSLIIDAPAVEDNEPPAAPGVPDLDTASDTGISNDDNTTYDTTPTFTISECEEDATVFVAYNDNIEVDIGDAQCVDGTASITSTVLGEGDFNIYAYQEDEATNRSSNSGLLSITVDTTPSEAPAGAPDLESTSDSGSDNTDNLTNDDTPLLIGTTCSAGHYTYLYADDVLVGTVACTEMGEYGVTASTLSDGTYEMTVRNVDTSGNTTAESPSLSIEIDTTAPDASGAPNMTAGTDSGTSASDNVTNDTTPSFTGTCTDGNTVRLYIGGTAVSGTATCIASAFSLTIISALASASHDVVFRETDAAGNWEDSAQLSIVIDAVVPVVSIVDPADEATVSGATVAITANVTELYFVGIQFKVNGTAQGAELLDVTEGEYEITWNTTAIADGDYTLDAVVRDVSGNRATSTISVTVLNAVPEDGGDDEQEEEDDEEEDEEEDPGGSDRKEGSRRSTSTDSSTSSGNDNEEDSPEGSGVSSADFNRDLNVGSTGSDVRALQIFLNFRGFLVALFGAGSPGNETDFFGWATHGALARFQEAYGIQPASGYLGEKTREVIETFDVPEDSQEDAYEYTRDLELGDVGADVQKLQELLIARDIGPAAQALAAHGTSDTFGPLTQAALIELQVAFEISPATGYFGPKTRSALGL
jgi:hypothetical protein